MKKMMTKGANIAISKAIMTGFASEFTNTSHIMASDPPTNKSTARERIIAPPRFLSIISPNIYWTTWPICIRILFLPPIGEFGCLHWAVEALGSIGLHLFNFLNPFFQTSWMNLPEGSLTLARRNNLILIFMRANPTPFSPLNFSF